VTFVEYANLPGIVSDRFHALATQGRSDGRILEEAFISLMLQVYSSSLDDKMQLTFKIFDFDTDGLISAEDVRILLSYIPFRQHHQRTVGKGLSPFKKSKNRSRGVSCSEMGKKLSDRSDDRQGEGLYQRGEGLTMNLQQRQNEQREIFNFVNLAFKQVQKLDYELYQDFNTKISSEMFVSVMSIL